MTNHPSNTISDVAKTGQIDRLLATSEIGQSLPKALREENCERWFMVELTDTDRAPFNAVISEQRQQAEQAATKSDTVLMFGSVSQKTKADFQALCKRHGLTTAERIAVLIAKDLEVDRRA